MCCLLGNRGGRSACVLGWWWWRWGGGGGGGVETLPVFVWPVWPSWKKNWCRLFGRGECFDSVCGVCWGGKYIYSSVISRHITWYFRWNSWRPSRRRPWPEKCLEVRDKREWFRLLQRSNFSSLNSRFVSYSPFPYPLSNISKKGRAILKEEL